MKSANIQSFGIDPFEVYTNNGDMLPPHFPEVELQLPTGRQREEILNDLRTNVNPMSNGPEFGIDTYLIVRQYLHSLQQLV